MTAALRWVGDRLGIEVSTVQAPLGLRVEELVGLGLRRNPRRAHLLVSRVLGKHLPTDPRIVYGSGLLLGLLVGDLLAGGRCGADTRVGLGSSLGQALASGSGADAVAFGHAVRAATAQAVPLQPSPTVLGFAETAVALGHAVADALPGSDYLHSTRRHTSVPHVGGFEEEHSHATSHLLAPHDPGLLIGPRAAAHALVLVDDELTTGRTALNTIAELHRLAPRPRYVIAALLDMRSAEDEEAMAVRARELGVEVQVVSLARGAVRLPEDVLSAAADLLPRLPDDQAPANPDWRRMPIQVGPPPPTQPAGLRYSGRHGISAAERASMLSGLLELAGTAAPQPGERLLVLGTEELMAAPLVLAQALADVEPSAVVRFSTTTRSPAVAVDDAGYPLRTAIAFDSNEVFGADVLDDDEADFARFAYNVRPGEGQPRWDRILVVLDEPADNMQAAFLRPRQLGAALSMPGTTYQQLVLRNDSPCDQWPAQEPHRDAPTAGGAQPLHGPQFGSYAAEEVTWLLTDLSGVHLEAPTAEREREIQAGRAHYAESLPIEFQPDAAYTALFTEAVAESSARLAYDLGLVAEIVWAERIKGAPATLVSLARAGVPVGILLRRWYQFTRGVSLPHVAISIVRGRGIDTVAMDYLARRGEQAIFVDGWTGKGAITRELTEAVTEYNASHGTQFNPDLVVLADPGRCVRTFGTRDDFLIPSACLNSTVSGLVSRTVLNRDLIGAEDFHGAKFYAELAGSDVSNQFLDAVSDRFADVADAVARDWPALAASDRDPDWAGWAAVEAISEQYGIGQVNLVKPGVGETTRVLLRRVPERVLIRPGHDADLQHVLVLAAQRGVPVEEVPDLPYSCVGLIRPQEGGEG